MITKKSISTFVSSVRKEIANADDRNERFVAVETKRIADERAGSRAQKRMEEIRGSIRRKPRWGK